MPLEDCFKFINKKGINACNSRNISKLMGEGRTRAQAVAIALNQKQKLRRRNTKPKRRMMK
jgi:hypothetical protein